MRTRRITIRRTSCRRAADAISDGPTPGGSVTTTGDGFPESLPPALDCPSPRVTASTDDVARHAVVRGQVRCRSAVRTPRLLLPTFPAEPLPVGAVATACRGRSASGLVLTGAVQAAGPGGHGSEGAGDSVSGTDTGSVHRGVPMPAVWPSGASASRLRVSVARCGMLFARNPTTPRAPP